MPKSKATCPQCSGPAGPRSENKDAPFCSERCRLLDLGSWLDGRYAIPGPPAAVPTQGEGEPDDWSGFH